MPIDGSGYAFCHPETGQPKKRLNDPRSSCAHSRRHLYVTTYTEGFSHFVTSMTAPVASGWSVRRVGACTHWKAPPSHGAHVKRTHEMAALEAAIGEGGRVRAASRRTGARAKAAIPSRAPKSLR
jgi:hypothetical protein